MLFVGQFDLNIWCPQLVHIDEGDAESIDEEDNEDDNCWNCFYHLDENGVLD